MAKLRPQKTLADYVVIAINPALIMLLVGSLVFFLLAVGYEGRFTDRLHWILGWFVLAIVLVARIAMEQGPEQARVYGLALAAATSLVVFRFVDAPWIAIPLLAVVWWCANKLTWDSTLVDDNEDASGEGLLQHAGLDEKTAAAAGDVPPLSDEPADDSDDQVPTAAAPPTKLHDQEKRPHAPGLWIVYFSLLALPLFGIGQLFIPASNTEGRDSAFRLLFVYVASALALLLTTSFLGLRRYLRQRRIRMPAPIATIWLAQGTAMILAILAVCILLPRPNATYSATAMLERIAEKEQQASRHAQLRGEGVDDDGRPIGKGESNDNANDGEDSEQNDEATQTGEKGAGGNQDTQQDDSKQQQNGGQQQDGGQGQQDSGDRQQDNGEQQGQQAGQTGQQGKNQQSSDGENGQSEGGRQQGGQSGEKGQGDEQSDQQQSDQGQESHDAQRPESDEHVGPQPQPPKPPLSTTGWLATFSKWLIYAFLAALLLWYVIRNRTALAESLRQMYLWFLGLFGRTEQESAAGGADDDVREAARATQPFASFANPFANGRAARMKPETLVVYTFEALQAWAREQGIERPGDQTPLEFVKTVAARHPDLAGEVALAGRLYARVAYASGSPSRAEVDRLEMLWRGLSRPAVLSASING
jgi:Domain of unknown function (DUF4129)